MTASPTQEIGFRGSECMDFVCPNCDAGTVISRLFVDLRSARVCAACQCGALILALGVSRDAYVQCVGLRLDQGEPSRIVKPTLIPVPPPKGN